MLSMSAAVDHLREACDAGPGSALPSSQVVWQWQTQPGSMSELLGRQRNPIAPAAPAKTQCEKDIRKARRHGSV